ncbi:MAG TPA: hypothetical protein VFJ28_01575 [Marmoricola sp.]|nr:hypothetical protein [Marmoricola sp.]
MDALRQVLTVATGPVVMLAEGLARIDGIESAFIDGSFAARLLGDVRAPDLPHRLPRKGHDVQRFHERICAVQTAFSGLNQR